MVTPNNDANGEDGTIQAGEYAKGDTATFFVYTDPGHVDNLHNAPKELFEKALMRGIGQKGTLVTSNCAYVIISMHACVFSLMMIDE